MIGRFPTGLTLVVVLLTFARSLHSAPPLPSSDSTDPEEAAERAIAGHVAQADVAAGRWTPAQLREAGRRLFAANFAPADGVGRPAANGSPFPTPRRTADPLAEPAPAFSRGDGPDANACASCHHQPFIGGAGDFSVNVFTGLALRSVPVDSFDREFSNERGSPALNGAGLIELLAREITADLHALRDDARRRAAETGEPVSVELRSKGIDFGRLVARPDGSVDADGVDGIDRDLVVRPFGAKGTITSLREFSVNAANLHHGMQAAERYGTTATGTPDFDRDGVPDELTVGDVTALAVYQALLNTPGRVLPASSTGRAEVDRGERLFVEVGCADCHVPELPLTSAVFMEPNPFNPPGNLRPDADATSVAVNLAADGPAPRVARTEGGGFVVRAFTDFKRHKIADGERPFFRNEIVVERGLETDVFLTKRLWACGNTAPYGHRGDLVTLTEAIRHHGGDAAPSRRRHDALPPADRAAIRAFLRSLRILPAGSKPTVIEAPPESLPYAPLETTP